MKVKKFLKAMFSSFLFATLVFGFSTVQAAGSAGSGACGNQGNGCYYVQSGDCCVLIHGPRSCQSGWCW